MANNRTAIAAADTDVDQSALLKQINDLKSELEQTESEIEAIRKKANSVNSLTLSGFNDVISAVKNNFIVIQKLADDTLKMQNTTPDWIRLGESIIKAANSEETIHSFLTLGERTSGIGGAVGALSGIAMSASGIGKRLYCAPFYTGLYYHAI